MLFSLLLLLLSHLSCLLGPEHLALQGAQAHAAGVLFPSDDEVLQRTILIANINPLINTEQVFCNASVPAVSMLCHVARSTGLSLTCLFWYRSNSYLVSVVKSRAAAWWATTNLHL